jgi:hypothetical protein
LAETEKVNSHHPVLVPHQWDNVLKGDRRRRQTVHEHNSRARTLIHGNVEEGRFGQSEKIK